jgi:UDP-N-acetylglucosamine 4,6-dehydratase/5-epimerase
MLDKKKLLITGGTGTFGNAVLQRFLHSDIAEIRILSRDEKKQDDMRRALVSTKVKFYIGDVRQYDSLLAAMNGVDYVFHAAALKQVPSCEFFPIEAVRTNTLGTENVLNAAIVSKVKMLVTLSTDKAVYPVNAMGMSKALMEKLMIAKARLQENSGTILCGTRYGNVMGSRGSVIPLFVSQILSGQPITITDPNMTRFMMTIEDAVDLVLYAFQHAHPGDIFIQKAPAATILTLAEALKNIFDSNAAIRVLGTRHGEKLFETLMNREEMAKAEDLGNYFRVPADDRDLNYSLYFNEGRVEVSEAEEYDSHNTHRMNREEMARCLLKVDCVKQALEHRYISI